MSDGRTHFKNETLRRVFKGLKFPHHFTLLYCPWSNGTVDRLGREILGLFLAVVSELRVNPDKWPDLLPLVQKVP